MSDEIIKVLDDLSKRWGMAVDWTSSNALPYLQQLAQKYVNYKLAESGLELVTGLLLFAGAMKLVKIAKKCHCKLVSGDVDIYSEDSYVYTALACCVGAFIAFLVCFLLVSGAARDIITCMTFPEKMILDELLQTLNNH